MTVTAPSVLPGNLLSVTDSDFESGTLGWGGFGNCTVATSTAEAFSGNRSLAITATATGSMSIISAPLPVSMNKGLALSAYIYTADQGLEFNYTIYCKNASFGSTGTVTQAPANLIPATWGGQPWTSNLQFAGTAYVSIALTFGGYAGGSLLAGHVIYLDLCYVAQPLAQVLADFSNPAFIESSAAGSNFADLTPWVRLDTGISLTRGRQDAISEIQSGQASFPLENDTGWFTPQNSASPYPGINLGARTQINIPDQLGNWYTRFDGALTEIVYTVDVTGGTNIATVSAADVLTFLGRQDELQCWTKEIILTDGPWLHWTLDDDGQTGICAETSGNNGPVLRVLSGGGLTWQNTNGGVETQADAAAAGAPDGSAFWTPGQVTPTTPDRGLASGVPGPLESPLPSLYFAPALSAQTAQNLFVGNTGSILQAELYSGGIPTPITTSSTAYSLEAWFTMDPAIKASLSLDYGPFTVFSLGSSRGGGCIVAGLYLNSGALNFQIATYNQPPAFAMFAWNHAPAIVNGTFTALTADAKPVPHHVVLEIEPEVISFYLDGSYIGYTAIGQGAVYDTITVGGAYGSAGMFYGNISCVSIYQYALSASQVAAHCAAGQYGNWEQTTDNCIATLGTIAGIPGFWNNLSAQNNGLTLTDYISITGSNALENMQIFEQAERGLLFVDSFGQLVFHTRDWRMGYGATDLTLPADVYDPDMGYELIDTFVLNEAATSSFIFTTGVDWVSQTSVASFGTYANGTQESPVQLPLITWSRAYAALGMQPYLYWADPSLNDNASWQAYTRSQPRLTCGQLTIDLLTLGPTTGLTVSQFYALDIDNAVTLSGLPGSFANAPLVNDFFIEGINETLTQTAHTLDYYVSPAILQRAWKAGDPAYGELGVSSLIGISGPDLSVPPALGKTVSHDAGGPYWPPAFATAAYTYQIGYVNVTSLTPTLTPGNYGQGYSSQGDCLLAVVMCPAAATITVSDTEGNSYSQISTQVLSTGQRLYVFASFNSFPVNLNDTVTFNAGVSQAYTIGMYGITGVTGVDSSPVTSSSVGTTPAISLGTLGAGNDFEFVVVYNNSSDTCTIPSGWTQMGRNFSGTAFNQMYWKLATSTTGDTFTASLPGSVPWGAIGIAFSVAPYSMNNPANNNHSFIGATDIRGIRDNLATALCPPLLVAGGVSHNQTFTTGNSGIQHIAFDTVFVDTVGGMGAVNGWPNWYAVVVPGFYEVSASLVWDLKSSGAAGVRNAWIIIAASAAQALAAGTATPLTIADYILPAGEQVAPNNFSINPVCCPVSRVYLGAGDMISLGAMQSQGANDGSGINFNGSVMSLRWTGYGTVADRFPYSPQAPGLGTAAPGMPGRTKTYTKTYGSTQTYSYYGTGGTWTPQAVNTNGTLGQGTYPGDAHYGSGSRFSFALFNNGQMASDMSGATINSVKLKIRNDYTWYHAGGSLMIGWTTATTFGSSFTPGGGTMFDHRQVYFKQGQTLTADVGVAIGKAFQSGGATALAFGNNSTTDLKYYGYWYGGVNGVELIISYTK